jgi:NTE family protein
VELTGAKRAEISGDSGGSEGADDGCWLVLGGGGLKGLAHIGAWQALEEAGVRPVGIVGTSIGALVGALASSGMPSAEMRRLALALERRDIVRVNRRAVWINGVRQVSVFQGEPLREHYAALLAGMEWSALRIPLLINAVDLGNGDTEWFGTGARTDVSLLDAVYASSALPVFYPPFELDGHAYVDGGVTRTLPIGRAEQEGAARIIAVDVGSGGRAEVGEILDGGMIAVHQRVVSIMAWQRRYDLVSTWKGAPLTYVRPRLSGYGTFDFEHVEYFLDEGYRAMCHALENEPRPATPDGDS